MCKKKLTISKVKIAAAHQWSVELPLMTYKSHRIWADMGPLEKDVVIEWPTPFTATDQELIRMNWRTDVIVGASV